MSLHHNTNIVRDSLFLYYDVKNKEKSWKGIPTTNTVGGTGISVYNNVPSDVSITLTQTSELYRGYQVYREVITPTTASGVSYLTNANNPGIGVVSGGGGGNANVYTGHSIFFRSDTPLHPTYPIFTSYSNISGWQSNIHYEPMGDDWYRATVIWYDTVTRSDGKYWAINPNTATINVPITVYWAGPFKEERNDSIYVSQYTGGTRSTTNSVIDLMGNRTITMNNFVTTNDGGFRFNGSTTTSLTFPTINLGNGNVAWTVCAWVKTTTTVNALGQGPVLSNTSGGPVFSMLGVNNGKIVYWTYQNSAWSQKLSTGKTVNDNNWHFLCWVNYTNSTMDMYVDGVLDANVANSTSGNNNPVDVIGSCWSSGFDGQIDSVMLYTGKSLTAAEIRQNYNSTRSKYEDYFSLFFVRNNNNIQIIGNNTSDVTIWKAANNNSGWDSSAYCPQSFRAPCTLEFSKQADAGDNGNSYAMIGWNTDPTADANYTSLDYTSYPFRTGGYEVYHNGSIQLVQGSGVTWDANKRFYIVYDTDGYIRHYNGDKLLYTSPFYGTSNTVYVDSSFYSASSTFSSFKNIKVIQKSWNGTRYV